MIQSRLTRSDRLRPRQHALTDCINIRSIELFDLLDIVFSFVYTV